MKEVYPQIDTIKNIKNIRGINKIKMHYNAVPSLNFLFNVPHGFRPYVTTVLLSPNQHFTEGVTHRDREGLRGRSRRCSTADL